MSKKNREKKEMNRLLRDSLQRVLDNRVYFVATPTGSPMINPVDNVHMTWVRSSAADCQKLSDSLGATIGIDLQVGDMQVGPFLMHLCHFLVQGDLDMIQTEDSGNGHFPLSTWGVSYLLKSGSGEKWEELLQESRRFIDRNVLLLETLRQVIKTVSPPADQAVLLGVPDDELIRGIMGKRSGLPTVDLRTVWVLASLVNKEAPSSEEGTSETAVVPETLCISSSYQEEDPIVIGPLVFSSRDRVEKWALQVHPKLQEQLAETPVVYQAYRLEEFMGILQADFKPILPEGIEIDSLCLDGGLLPFTEAGAAYADAINMEDYEDELVNQPNFVTYSKAIETNGMEKFRGWLFHRVAAHFGFEVVQQVSPDQETPPDGLEAAVV